MKLTQLKQWCAVRVDWLICVLIDVLQYITTKTLFPEQSRPGAFVD